MKRFLGFVQKEFYHIFRDKRTLFILFGMPVVQILLFGFAVTNEINNIQVAIFDKSNDIESQKIIQSIGASAYFDVARIIYNEKDVEAIFKKGKVKAVLIFEPGFAKKLITESLANIQIITDATEPNTATIIANYINAILREHQMILNQKIQIPNIVQPQTRMLYNPELKTVFMFVPGVMTIILMLVSAMMTSISITREKEQGTMEILLVSPLKPVQVILGKVLPYVFLAVFNAVVILLLGYFVFGMPMHGSLWLLALESVLFILSALSLGVLISTISQTQLTAMMISVVGLLLPVILLSGFIFPITSMPKVLQILSNIVPAKWFIIALKGILIKGLSFATLWKETLILSGMTLFFIVVSVKKYKIRLE